jgi:RNA polymerase sigma-70 factor, ECF subfamily
MGQVPLTQRSGASARPNADSEGHGDRLQTDLTAFEALFSSHGARMKSLALNLLGNVADAEDAVQEAFLRAYRNRDTFRQGSSLFTWVCRILINTCYDTGRKRRSRHDSASLEDDLVHDPPSPAGDHPLRLTLHRAIEELAPIYQQVFLLCEVEGYTHREVAAILEIPEGTSKARLFEARRQLRSALGRSQGMPS